MSDQEALKNKLDELVQNKEEFLSIIVEACKRHRVSIHFDHKFNNNLSSQGFVGPKTKLDLQWRLSCSEIQNRLNEITEPVIPEPVVPWEEGKWIYGMTSNGEQAHYTETSRSMASVMGYIVDLGCWMGSTTISLVRGCIDFIDTQKIVAIDRFVWEGWMDYTIGECDNYKAGDDFMPEFIRRMGDYLKHITVIKANLVSYAWSGDPIKILLIDAMKTERLSENISREFYPSLIHDSIVIHQDFKHHYHSWIFVLHYRLREYFIPIFEASDSTTVSFKLVKQIPVEIIADLPRFCYISDQEIDDVFNWVESILRPGSNIIAARAMTYVHLKKFDKVDEVLSKYSRKYSEENQAIKDVKSRIVR